MLTGCEVDYKKKRSRIDQNEEAKDGLLILFVSDIDGCVFLVSVGIGDSSGIELQPYLPSVQQSSSSFYLQGN